MFKRIVFIVCAGMLFFGTAGLSYSQQEEKDAAAPATAQPIDVGNKICPVTGEKIDEKLKATYEYEGKIYNFCCPDCIGEFKKDPQKYIKKVEQELQAEPESQTEHGEHQMQMMPESETSNQGMHGSHHH